MRILGVIPARLGSTRLPNKPLQLLAGEPLVTRVVQRVLSHQVVDRLVVATESPMVARVAERSGVEAVLTHDGHLTGTERVAEAAGRPEFSEFELVVNIQGDEPFITREALEGSIGRVAGGDQIGTAAAPLDAALASDLGRVKVVTDLTGRALYFSRSVIPHRWESSDQAAGLYWQHLGVYAYSRAVLARWVALPPTPAEQAERLEQLRALQHGLTIGVARLAEPTLPG
ncbi:MAG: 3-deoxy-manno-octulosonate cytidylyltransferase, partial [Gemmatimonadales bacterium]